MQIPNINSPILKRQNIQTNHNHVIAINIDKYGTRDILGKIKIHGGNFMFFSLNYDQAKLYLFESMMDTIPNKIFSLSDAHLIEETSSDDRISIMLGSGRLLQLILFQNLNKKEIRILLQACTSHLKFYQKTNSKPKSKFPKLLGKGCKFIVSFPFKLSTGIIYSLEKVSDGAKKTPEILFTPGCNSNKNSMPKKRVKPSNPASGLFFGTTSALKEIISALYGLFAEPVRGAKKEGFIGATKGFGKGIVGLILKPVAGTIDIVTFTARGISNMPVVIYRKIARKDKKFKKYDLKNPNQKADLSGIKYFISDGSGGIYLQKDIDITANDLNKKMDDMQTIEESKKLCKVSKDHTIKKILLLKNLSLRISEDYINNKVLIQEVLDKIDILNQKYKDTANVIHKLVLLLQNHLKHLYYLANLENESLQQENAIINAMKQYLNESKSITDLKQDLTVFLAIDNHDNQTSQYEYPILSIHQEDLDNNNKTTNSIYRRLDKSLSLFVIKNPDKEELFNSLKIKNESKNLKVDCLEELEIVPINIETINNVQNLNEQVETIKSRSDSIKKKSNKEINIPTIEEKSYDMEYSSRINDPIKLTNKNDTRQSKIEDLHWPQASLEALKNPVIKVNGPDIISMDDCMSTFKFLESTSEEILEMIKNWKFLTNHDDIRFPFAYKKGGKCPEKEIVVKKLRLIAKEVIMNVGKKLLSGNFNLTTVSFPIKAMVPKSHLENIALGTCFFPLYINLAVNTQDPLQRFKYYITSSISYYYLSNSFAKPLNPILGETLHGHYNDGSKIFLEQTSHHPPISYILMYGPNQSYKYYGPSIFSASAGLNSLTLIVKGWRKCIFKNPDQIITNTFPNETYDGTFFGQVTHETVGDMEFIDKENEIYCHIIFGKVKKKPTDYFEGEIKVKGKCVSKITGTYLGWLEFDGERYFDYRFALPFKFFIERSRLASDFTYRNDLYYLHTGDIPKAQKEKDALELIQRNDAKLRKSKMEKSGKKR